MKIRRKELIDKFVNKHADVKNALQDWVAIIEEARWKSHADIKMDFPSADYIGKERYVFNIKGNNYRVVATVLFITGSFIICFLGTHGEYDKIDCRTI